MPGDVDYPALGDYLIDRLVVLSTGYRREELILSANADPKYGGMGGKPPIVESSAITEAMPV